MAQPRYHISTKKEGCCIIIQASTRLPLSRSPRQYRCKGNPASELAGLGSRGPALSGERLPEAVCLIIRADQSSSDNKTAGVCQSVKGCGGGKPHMNVRPLSHRHFCRVVQRPGEVVPQFPFSGIESLDIGTGKRGKLRKGIMKR